MNCASRMMTTCEVNQIQLCGELYHKLLAHGKMSLLKRGKVSVKGKGDLLTYWLLGRRN